MKLKNYWLKKIVIYQFVQAQCRIKLTTIKQDRIIVVKACSAYIKRNLQYRDRQTQMNSGYLFCLPQVIINSQKASEQRMSLVYFYNLIESCFYYQFFISFIALFEIS